jgi:membrane protease YdiL (CAAX protease family)
MVMKVRLATRLVRVAAHPISALVIFVALSAIFASVLHPWFMNWGATAEEQAMALPGDSAPPGTYFTRAIAIDAPPSAVWPWLLAIGQDRAGFLSNDYLENLTGADIHNAAVLRPEWQQRALGDRVPMTSPEQRAVFGDVTSTTIRLLEPERAIADTPGRFVLLPAGQSSTRLLLRESLDDPLRNGAMWVIWDPMHFVMEQRLLQGVKERAEGRPLVPPVLQLAAIVGWALAAVWLLGLFLLRRAWRLWLVLPIGVVIPALVLTGDINSVMAGFLAVGITVAGFLHFGWRWCGPYLLLASAVALTLLLAPDSYTTFGLIFLATLAVVGVRRLHWIVLVSAVRRQPVQVLFLLAFAISWSAILWLVAPTGIPGTGSDYLARGPLVYLAMLLGPSIAGVSLTLVVAGRSGLADLWMRQRRWRVGRWWAAVLVTPVVVLAMGALSSTYPQLALGVLIAPDKSVVISFALVVGLGAGLIEELGWTGFALPRLQRYGWFRAGVVLGVLWGLWHLLADYWGSGDTWATLYAPRYLLWCIAAFTAYRVLMSWAYSHTGSLLLAQMMHASFTGGQALLMPALTPSATGMAWYVIFAGALWVAVAIVVAAERVTRPALALTPVAATK